MKTLDWEKVNANVAVWARDKDDISDEEYHNFYKVKKIKGEKEWGKMYFEVYRKEMDGQGGGGDASRFNPREKKNDSR